ncbi:S-layer homology domain-containing protein [Paenibacillus koleovorans]|uniref:S-layer homology domain-containing protein n=1 Tax=Paenibacillus koleovorans TaxID=121608 RepID=UPI000FDA29F1|nr:S-layer homology domain-containing protein [Paenibacillus koleovorans]
MKKKLAVVVSAAMLMSSLSFGTAFAFRDVDHSQAEAVTSLQQKGIVSGLDAETFAPQASLTYAQGIQFLVRAFDYNLDSMRFIKMPVASELFANVKDNEWYSDAFIAAFYNGVEIPKDVNPNGTVTKEQFASWLDAAFQKMFNRPMINIKMELKDEADITPSYQGSILRLIHYKIAELDANEKFNPQQVITRGEAAAWIHNAMKSIDGVKTPVQTENVTFQVEKVNENVNKVTISRGEKPTAGYKIAIDSIQFTVDGQALIRYKLTDPAADEMAAQVITTPTDVTYISSKYEVKLEAVK